MKIFKLLIPSLRDSYSV